VWSVSYTSFHKYDPRSIRVKYVQIRAAALITPFGSLNSARHHRTFYESVGGHTSPPILILHEQHRTTTHSIRFRPVESLTGKNTTWTGEKDNNKRRKEKFTYGFLIGLYRWSRHSHAFTHTSTYQSTYACTNVRTHVPLNDNNNGIQCWYVKCFNTYKIKNRFIIFCRFYGDIVTMKTVIHFNTLYKYNVPTTVDVTCNFGAYERFSQITKVSYTISLICRNNGPVKCTFMGTWVVQVFSGTTSHATSGDIIYFPATAKLLQEVVVAAIAVCEIRHMFE